MEKTITKKKKTKTAKKTKTFVHLEEDSMVHCKVETYWFEIVVRMVFNIGEDALVSAIAENLKLLLIKEAT